ncbi:DUF808 domain-containing protein [Halioxenophilus aromaticivorans]|uniref:DUF808 domain-containing protein n=1 Tax=Halioxenophilus aromaticivorans TaxID=1306992 RepID=A0AAV3U674_9ALTE
MAFAGLLALLDDIATVLDDVSVMTKVAAKKTAGVLGDDLALNAEQVTGLKPERELPVVWAVFKGSVINKCILVPAALLISAVLPWLITPLLMVGGGYLCFEGFEKVFHKWLHGPKDAAHEARKEALADPNINLAEFEKEKIKGAVRTDFILSAEIVVIALGVVADASFSVRLGVVVAIAILITLAVYGLVAAIVKLDDLGFYLSEPEKSSFSNKLGRGILVVCPYILKTLTIVGTAAMFLVGGGILLHGIPGGHDVIHVLEEWVHNLPLATVMEVISGMLLNAVVGIVAGGVLVGIKTLVDKIRGGSAEAH